MLSLITPENLPETLIGIGAIITAIGGFTLHRIRREPPKPGAPDAATAALAENTKAVLAMAPDGRSGRALYFTRSVLYGDQPVWLHHGVYGYRREALRRFTAAPSSPLELRERLEQLRALEMGMSIWAAVIDSAPISVDNPGDLERARAFARGLK